MAKSKSTITFRPQIVRIRLSMLIFMWSKYATTSVFSVFFFLLVFAIVHQFKIIILLTSAKVGIIFELCKFLDDYLHGRIILA